MGATNFSDVGRGKTIESAFANAVKRAYYDYGHGGYTGSIAEKHGYIEFDRPNRWTPQKIETLVWQAADFDATRRERPQKFTKWINETDEQFKARKAQARKWARESEKAYDKLIELFGRRDAERLIAIANDKWGPCAAIPMPGTKTMWYFFGLASC